MSLKTWKKEFYPISANRVKKHDAIAHSLRKLIGLLPENLGRHDCLINNLTVLYTTDRPYDGLPIDSRTCALCRIYGGDCEDCPLFKLHDTRCNEPVMERPSLYHQFTYHNNPKPMIAALKKCLAIERRGKAHKERIK